MWGSGDWTEAILAKILEPDYLNFFPASEECPNVFEVAYPREMILLPIKFYVLKIFTE